MFFKHKIEITWQKIQSKQRTNILEHCRVASNSLSHQESEWQWPTMCCHCNYSGAERYKTCRNIICFQFINDFKRSGKRNSTDCVENSSLLVFWSKSARFEASIVNIAHCLQEVFKYFGYTKFWYIKSESSSEDFSNVVGYSNTDSHFLQMVQAFKGRESYVYRTWSSSLVNVLSCDFAIRSWRTKTQSKGDKSIFKLYRVLSLPRFYLGELSRGNFGAIPQPNRGKKTSYCGNAEGNPRVGPAATTRQMGL